MSIRDRIAMFSGNSTPAPAPGGLRGANGAGVRQAPASGPGINGGVTRPVSIGRGPTPAPDNSNTTGSTQPQRDTINESNDSTSPHQPTSSPITPPGSQPGINGGGIRPADPGRALGNNNAVFKGVGGAGIRTPQQTNNQSQTDVAPETIFNSTGVAFSTNTSQSDAPTSSPETLPTSDKLPGAPSRRVSIKLQGLMGGLNLNADQLQGGKISRPVSLSTSTTLPRTIESVAVSGLAAGGSETSASSMHEDSGLKHLSLERPKLSNPNRRSAGKKAHHSLDLDGGDTTISKVGANNGNASTEGGPEI